MISTRCFQGFSERYFYYQVVPSAELSRSLAKGVNLESATVILLNGNVMKRVPVRF